MEDCSLKSLINYNYHFHHGKVLIGFFKVVWRAMQEEFIRQYKYIEDLLQRCYPGAQISLDFAMTEILEYFSDIAMNH